MLWGGLSYQLSAHEGGRDWRSAQEAGRDFRSRSYDNGAPREEGEAGLLGLLFLGWGTLKAIASDSQKSLHG